MAPKSGNLTLTNSLKPYVFDDAGNGKGSVARHTGAKVVSHTFPHGRVRITGKRINVPDDKSFHVDETVFEGVRWGIGDGIYYQTDYPIDVDQNTKDRYGSDFHIHMSLTGIVALTPKRANHNVKLVITVPPGYYNDVAEHVQAAFMAGEQDQGDGVWTIEYNGKPRTVTFEGVRVVPEGRNAFAAYAYNVKGKPVSILDSTGKYELLSGRVRVVDLGFGTSDEQIFVNGTPINQNASRATNRLGGISTHIHKPLQDMILEMVPDANWITIPVLDYWVRLFIGGVTMPGMDKPGQYVVNNRKIDLETPLLAFADQYGKWVWQNICAPGFAEGDDGILAVGGGWEYAQTYIRRKAHETGRQIITPEDVPHLKGVEFFELQVIGLAHAMAEAKARQLETI